MFRRRHRSSKKNKPFRSVLLETITTVIILLLVYLSLGVFAAAFGTSIFHTLGGGFSLRDDIIRTSVLVRNDAPFSLPGIELPYSYGARIEEGNARCEVQTVEGIQMCGSGTVGLGTIKQGEVKNGTVTIFPNHGNFTVRYVASVWVFFFHSAVADVVVSCWTNDGIAYGCVGSGERRPGPRLSPQRYAFHKPVF